MPIIEHVAGKLTTYFREYGDEMTGVARGLGVKPGDVVLFNLIMQLEGLGLNCSTWNNTGPTHKDDPGCMAVDPDQKWCYCHKAAEANAIPPHGWVSALNPPAGMAASETGPGLCSSVVAQTERGTILHGRNMDWNLPASIRAMIIDIEYVRGNRTIAIGTGTCGTAGILNGMRYRDTDAHVEPWSVSINARGKGGKLVTNALQALLTNSITPTQNMRKVLTDPEATSWASAVKGLGQTPQIDENYFIVGGSKSGEGAIIARTRDGVADTWYLDPQNEDDGWFRLETNYDWWQPVPTADDRRTPGRANMRKVGQHGLNNATLWGVMTAWPTFNHHTDYTGIFEPAVGLYNSTLWF